MLKQRNNLILVMKSKEIQNGELIFHQLTNSTCKKTNQNKSWNLDNYKNQHRNVSQKQEWENGVKMIIENCLSGKALRSRSWLRKEMLRIVTSPFKKNTKLCNSSTRPKNCKWPWIPSMIWLASTKNGTKNGCCSSKTTSKSDQDPSALNRHSFI